VSGSSRARLVWATVGWAYLAALLLFTVGFFTGQEHLKTYAMWVMAVIAVPVVSLRLWHRGKGEPSRSDANSADD
jgi:hypothetical protein